MRTIFILLVIEFFMFNALGGEKDASPYAIPVLHGTLEQRVKAIATVTYKGQKGTHNGHQNDTRAGDGFFGSELFELHRELRQLVHLNFNKQPTDREVEILKLLRYGKENHARWEYIERTMRKKIAKGEGVSLFYDGYYVNELMIRFRATGDRAYLDCAVVQADYVMADYESRTGKEYYTWATKHGWLGLGRGYSGVAELAFEVARNPELHNLKISTQGSEISVYSQMTYLERSKRWIPMLQELIEFRKSTDKYDNGKWYQTDKEIHFSGGPAATNRYLYYVHFLSATASAAEAIDPRANKRWSAGVRKTVDEAIGYFQRTFHHIYELRQVRSDNMIWSNKHNAFMSEYGPYVTWAYKPGRNNTEDYVHLTMDIEAFYGIFCHDPTILPDAVLQKIAVTLMVCTYNYNTGGIPFNIDPKSAGRNPNTEASYHRFYAPKYGKYIGKYLNNKAFNKFMDRQLLIWDAQLLKGQLGRLSQYPMPKEILEARWFRYNKNAVWPYIGY